MTSIVLIDSIDVTGSIGRAGFLPSRLQATRHDAPSVGVHLVPGGRCDVVEQRLGQEPPQDQLTIPPGLEAWFSGMMATHDIPTSTSVLALSMADAVTAKVWRRQETGLLVQPPADHEATWTAEQLAWLEKEFEPIEPDDEVLDRALRSIAELLAPLDAEFVVFNASTFVPNEKVYWFKPGTPETIGSRANRVNLVVERLAGDVGITLVDVDRIVAELGAGQVVTDAVRYTPEALDVLSEEAMAIILDLPNISRDFASDAMQLSVPRYDRRTKAGTLIRWHVTEGTAVSKGDTLFDLRFENIQSRLNTAGRHAGQEMALSVVAGRDGILNHIGIEAGEAVTVGTRVGVITTEKDIEWGDIGNAAQFPVGIRVEARDDES